MPENTAKLDTDECFGDASVPPSQSVCDRSADSRVQDLPLLRAASPNVADGLTIEKAEVLCIELASYFGLDNTYRDSTLSLTASENYPSKLARLSGAAMHGAFYEFRPPQPP